MTPEQIVERLAEVNPEAYLLEPRDVYDAALVGLTDDPKDHWPREAKVTVAIYDEDKCIEAIMEWMDTNYEGALDWFGFNTSGAYVGEGTPTFTSDEEEFEDD